MDCCCHKLVLPRGPGPCNSFFLRIDRNASTGYTRTTTSTSMARLCCQPNRRTKRNEREKIKYRLDRANGRSTRAKTCIPPLPPSLSPSLSLSFCLRRGTFFGTERNIAIVRASAPKHADIPVGLLHFYIFIASRIVLASAGTPTSFATKIRDIEFACHPSAVYVPPSPSFLRRPTNRFVRIKTLPASLPVSYRSNERLRSRRRFERDLEQRNATQWRDRCSRCSLFFDASRKKKEGERKKIRS